MASVDSNTRLAVDRTRLAYERTMMAWVRTGTSLITFGFSIYKFFQIEKGGSPRLREGILGASHFSILMVLIGLAALLIATIENWRERNLLRAEYPEVRFPPSLARIFAALVSTLGVLALIAIILGE